MDSEMYKIQHGDYTFVTEIDTGAEVGTNQVTLWFREKGRDGGLQFLRAFYFEEANDDNIHTFCREFALYPDYRREILTGQRHWTKRNALFVRNLYSVLGEQVLLASDPSFERRAREFFRWLDLHAEEILALDDYKKFKGLDNASQPHTALLDPLIQPVVALLRQLPGVATRFSCQGISGKVRFQEYELMAVSPHQEYAYVSFESLSYFAHDSIVAQLPSFPHVTLARIPCNFASEFHLRSTGNNQRFLAELMTLAQSLLATRQGNEQNLRAERKLTRWETAVYPERRPRIAAPGGILPSRLEWLCQPEQIERTLRLLFHLNHWAKASTSLFYVDRQGLYTIKAAFIQQAYVAHTLQPVAYIDGIATFARGFTIEMATDIAAEFLLDRLALLFEKGRRSSVEDTYDTAARKLFERISGHMATSAIDIKTITYEQARKYIHVTLQELIEQARLTRQPISYDELAALLIGPTDLLALPYNRERLVEFWHDLDETNARKLDPEGGSLIAFQYSRAGTRYTFHLPFRVAERFLPSEILQGLQERHMSYSRELGVYYGRSITEAESRACNLPEILDELAINIDDLCPRKLANKEEIYTPFLREHWEMGDEEDEEGKYEEEIYGSGRSKGTKRGSRSEYRAQRHLQLLCPLCKRSVADTVSARIAHWRQAHPRQDLTISQATWVLRQSETELKASKLKPDYQALGPQPNQNGTRYWKLATLETHAAKETICSW
jgi:hypothetical protein